MWAARALERRPAVRDAAASGRISLGQAKAIGEALDGLPTSLERGQRAEAEQLILTEAQHAPAEKLRAMTEKILQQVAPEKSDSREERAEKLAARDLCARSRRKLWFGLRAMGPSISAAVSLSLPVGGCAFPGCTAPMRHCDLHHVRPWQEGGPTIRDKLVAFCRVHHTICEPRPPTIGPSGQVSAPDGWEVRIETRGLPEFIPPAALDPSRTPVRRKGHAATLFDHDQPRRAG